MVRIVADFRSLTRSLSELTQRQVPFATARALTDMANASAVANRRALPSIFDRPTPFTLNSVAVKPAKKGDLVARVFVKDKQAKYLALEETGGTRRPERQALIMPKAAPRNSFGNLPRRGLAALKRQKDVFVGKSANGAGGFFRRLDNGKLQPLALFISTANYKPRFGFKDRVVKVARATMTPAFRGRLSAAIRSARG